MFEGSANEIISSIVLISTVIGCFCGVFFSYIFWLVKGKKDVNKLITEIVSDNTDYQQNKAKQIKKSELDKEKASYKKKYFDMLSDNLYKSCQLISADNTSTLNDCEFKDILGSIQNNLNAFNPFEDEKDAHIIQKNQELIDMLVKILDKCNGNDALSAYKEEIIKKMNEYFSSSNLDNYEDEIKNYRNKFVDNNSLNTGKLKS